jgi:dCTP deaminase
LILPISQWSAHGISLSEGNGPIDPVAHADEDESVVVDLHVGKAFFSPGPDAGTNLHAGKVITLQPGDAVRVETSESIQNKGRAFGQVCSRSSLTYKGLIVSNIKIDPHFRGKLQVTVYNVGRRPVRLPSHEEGGFCSVFFQSIVSEVEGPMRSAPPPPRKETHGLRDFVARNKRGIITVVVSLILSISGSLIATAISSSSASDTPADTTATTLP